MGFASSVYTQILPYEQLLIELDLSNMRDLEDLIIEAVYEVCLCSSDASKCIHTHGPGLSDIRIPF